MESVKVNCYSGHTYAERPKSFQWQGREYEVASLEKEWQEPRERHFKIITRDNQQFHICYNEAQQQWWLTKLSRS